MMHPMILRRRRISGSGGGGADAYAIGGASPELVAAFTTQSDGTTAGEYYRKASSETTFSGLFTFSRSGTATYFDSNGTLQTAADGVARTQAYRYNSGWELAGMQMEAAAATNLALYSTDFSQWTAGGSNIDQTANQANGPRGANTMTKLSAKNGSGSHYARDLFSLVTGNNVFSYFVKSAGEGVHPQIRATGESGGFAFVNFDIDNGTVGNSGGTNLGLTGIDDFGGGLYRIWAVINHTASGNGALLALCETPATDGELPVFSNDGAGFYCDIAQVEAGSVPSSPIITTGSTVTRAAETLSIAAADLPYSATAMSISMKGRMTYADNGIAVGSGGTGGEVQFYRWTIDANDYIRAALDTSGGRIGRVDFAQEDGGTRDVVSSATDAYSPGINVPFNIASRHGSTFINGAVDGTALTANLTPTALADLSGTAVQLGYTFNGFISEFRMWGTDIGDSGIAEVTSA